MAPRVLRTKTKVAPIIEETVVTNNNTKINDELKQINDQNINMENEDANKKKMEKTKQGKNKKVKIHVVENIELVNEVIGKEGTDLIKETKIPMKRNLNREITNGKIIMEDSNMKQKETEKESKNNEAKKVPKKKQGRKKKQVGTIMENDIKIVSENDSEREKEKLLLTNFQDKKSNKKIIKNKILNNIEMETEINKIEYDNIEVEEKSLKGNKNTKKGRKDNNSTEIEPHKNENLQNAFVKLDNILLKVDSKVKKSRKQTNPTEIYKAKTDKEITKDNKIIKTMGKGKGRKQKDAEQTTSENEELKEKKNEKCELSQEQGDNVKDTVNIKNKKSKLVKTQENKSKNKKILSKAISKMEDITIDMKLDNDINAEDKCSEEVLPYDNKLEPGIAMKTDEKPNDDTYEQEKSKPKKRPLKSQKKPDEPFDKKQKLEEKVTTDKKKAPLKNKSVTNYENIDFSNSSKSSQGDDWNFKIANWNVDGIRAWINKGGLDYIKYEKPDIICLQEVKCLKEKLPEETNIPGYHSYWLCSDSSGYAGVGIYTAKLAINVQYGLHNDEIDGEGRVITAEYEQFYLISTYVPNAGRKLVTLPKRLKWNELFRNHVMKLDEKKPVIICGDMNVAHNEIDLANPKGNKKNAGFTQEERAGMTELLGDGFIDTFRHLNPDKKGAYTFWTYMMNSRTKNVGWRLDYFIISKRLLPSLCDSVIRDQVYGSDHCPISLFLHLTSAVKPK